MPLKITVSRKKFAIKATIISSVLCLIPAAIMLALVISKNQSASHPYFIFSLTLLGINVLLAVLYGFVIRRDKTLYYSVTIALFSSIVILALVGYLTSKANSALLVQLA